MKIFSNQHHHLHHGQQEMFRGRMVDCHEVPQRLDHVLSELAKRPVGQLLTPPTNLNLATALSSIHTSDYLTFLATAWDEWVKLSPDNASRDALPSVWPLPGQRAFRMDKPPLNFAAKLGQYAFDSGTPFMSGTWQVFTDFAPQALVVPLGLDTYEGDPISGFKLKSADYFKVGRAIGELQLPTLFTLEGGYAVADFGINTVNVLEGFQT
jgi:acetoin utilization deacetylase AcuC-like enzyme